MADSKITALTSIGTSTDPSLDQMVIVDTSDGSMAATGTTKKVSLNQLLSSNPSATGGLTLSGALAAGSASITGDLTVDTSTLKVDSANNRVGIGTASPLHPLHVASTAATSAFITSTASTTSLVVDNTNANNWGGNLAFRTGGSYSGYLGPVGSLLGSTSQDIAVWASSGNGIVFHTNGNGTARATLDSSGNLGVGGSPNDKLEVVGSGSAGIRVSRAGVSTQYTTLSAGATGPSLDASAAIGALTFGLGGSTAMTLNSTGLGVGTSPSQKLHLYSNTTPAAIRLQSASPYAYPGDFTVGAGGFGTPSFYIYDNTNSAFRFVLDTSGNVGIGVTPSVGKLQVNGGIVSSPPSTPPTLDTNGQLCANATSNTNLRFSYRGSDGVTRVANITLA